ncbi:hypothetical protein [Mucilaginibacter antarcticus]|uniref:Uncharacterized protein n=1 Tax=Mucilaginibacter antarcticus TaxID=1855725 RepID=A0ABW5XM92_9SPHI
MSDAAYQAVVLSDIEKKIGKDKVDRLEGFEKNVIKVNDKYVILIKYCSNQSTPYFQFTDKEVENLLAIEKTYPSKTFVVFTTGNKISCSLNLKELSELCIIQSAQRSIYIDDITLSSYVVKGSVGEKRVNKNQYLSFLN